MRKAPLESTCHLRRGHENEEAHAQRFWSKYSAVREMSSYDALKNAKGSRPWMRYSPDDMVLMPMRPMMNDDGQLIVVPTPGEMHRWLIDYKAPSKVEESDEIAFQYACQLTQGAILCAENNVPIAGMMLSQFDWANWSLKDDVLGWDQDVGQMVVEAGDFYWNCVLNGEVPRYISKQEVEGLDEYTSKYAEAAETFASLSALADAAKKRADEVRKFLLQPIEGLRLGSNKITFDNGHRVLTVSAQKLMDRELITKLFDDTQLVACEGKKAEYNADLMAAFLRSQNIDLKPFRKYDLDSAKVFALAASLGMDADALVAERIVASPDAGIKAQMAAYINEHYSLEEIRRSLQAQALVDETGEAVSVDAAQPEQEAAEQMA